MTDQPRPWHQLSFGITANKPYRLARPIETGPPNHYTLAFIEFDDQGWYHSLDQRKALADFLDAKANDDLIILVFIHGWKHNAAAGDNNIAKFRELLEGAHRSEVARGGGRGVLGVYVSWRGLSLSGNPLWENLSFYARKSAALRVAIGSVRDTLALLKTYRDQRHANTARRHPEAMQPHSETEGARLFVAGHSFGGLILFSALSEYLMESTYSRDIISPFGDLIILVNPAFEATRYQPLATALIKHRRFADGQIPVFIAFTATNDDATGKAFPLGRWFGTRMESTLSNALPPPFPSDAQRKANLNTIGHLSWLTTHTLSAAVSRPGGAAPQRNAADAFHAEASDFHRFNLQYRSGRRLKPSWQRSYTSGAHLAHTAGDPNNPFWIVETSPEVIDGHNGIFKPIFIDFLGQLVDDRLRPV